MKSNYTLQKNLSFILIIFLGLNYIIFLFLAGLKIMPGFLMQLLIIFSVLKDHLSIKILFSSLDIYINFLAGIFIIIFWLKFIYAIYQSIGSVFKTNRYINSFITIPKRSYNILSSSEYLAFTAGLLKPQIYLSQAVFNHLTKNELESVRQHEFYHQLSFDPGRNQLVKLIVEIFIILPCKKQLLENYLVLTELSADFYSQSQTKSIKALASALNKMLAVTNNLNTLNLSTFALNNNRIKVLTGQEVFKTRYYLTFLFIISAGIIFNTILISNANIFMQCEHIAECARAIFSSTANISLKDNVLCISSNYQVINYHCMKITGS